MRKIWLLILLSLFITNIAFAGTRVMRFPSGTPVAVAESSDIAAVISDTAYDATSWDGVTDVAPSKNSVRDKIEGLAGGHDAVTLDVNADTLLSLSTQELGLDTQTANYILSGPATGAAAVPTFRAIVDDDIPNNITVNELTINAKEENTSNITIGQAVYVSGSAGAGQTLVGLINNTDSTKIRALGLAAGNIAQNTTGTVRLRGELPGVDTLGANAVNPNGETWAAGARLYCTTGSSGGLTNVRPTSGRIIVAGYSLIGSHNNDTILVQPYENPTCLAAASGEDICVRMGDNGGVNKVCFKDYANNDVACVDSNGIYECAGLTIGSAVIIEAELEMIDGITAGTAAASKALILDASLNIATINSLTATTLVGALTGNADTATVGTTVTITDNENTAENNPIVFVAGADPDGGNLGLETDGDFHYNPSTGTVTATVFVGALTGNVTGDCTGSSGSCTGLSATATALATARTIGGVNFDGTANIVPTTITVADTTDTTSFVALWESATGDLLPKSDAGIAYNAGTGMLTVNVTGALTGNADTCTTASAGDAAVDFFGAGVDVVTDATTCTDIEGNLLTIDTGVLKVSGTKDNLETAISDVADFYEADGDTLTGTHDFSGATVTLPSRTANKDFLMVLTIPDPNAYHTDIDAELPVIIDAEAAFTITDIYITHDTDPGTELNANLRKCTAYISKNTSTDTIINALDTTSGVLDDNSITAGSVSTGDDVYIQFDAAPDGSTKTLTIKIKGDYD